MNIARINNKEENNEKKELIKNYKSIEGEKNIFMHRILLNTKKEIKRVYYSPSKTRFNKIKKNMIENEKKEINNNLLSDDEKVKEKEKEKIREKKIEEEDESIINRKKFQSESEKEKRMRRTRKYFQKEDKDKDKKKEKEKNNIQKNEEVNKEIIKEEKIKNKINEKNQKEINNITNNNISSNNTVIKEKTFNCFSMQNLFGIKKTNKNNLFKDSKKNDELNANSINKLEIDENNTNYNSSINIKRNQYIEKNKYKKNKEEIRKNEEENKKTNDTIDDNEKWKKKRKDIIPRKLRRKNLSYRLKKNKYKNKDKDLSNNLINKEEIETNREINNEYNRQTKIKISEDVLIEEIDTTKPVVRLNIINQLYTKNKKYKNIYLYGFDKKNNFFVQFDLRKKKFLRIKLSDIEDLSESFEKEYIYQNTILYNTLTGVFILTGKNNDMLYYYNSLNETLVKLCQFKNSHNSGCLLLDQENSKIFIIGGKNSVICEALCLDTNEVIELPNLNFDRCNASFTIYDNKIFGFFGFSFKKGKYLFNIEYIDKNKLDKWNTIELNFESKKDMLPFHLKYISTYIKENDPGKIIIYGGKQGRSEKILDNYYYIYDIDKNIFEKIEGICFNIIKDFRGINIWKNFDLIENEEKKGFFFDKEKHFIELPKEDKFDGNNTNVSGIIDNECNVHFLTNNQKNINVYKFAK